MTNAGGAAITPTGGIDDSLIARYAAADGAYVWAKTRTCRRLPSAWRARRDPDSPHTQNAGVRVARRGTGVATSSAHMLRASLLTLVVAWTLAAARLLRPSAARAVRQLRTGGPRA